MNVGELLTAIKDYAWPKGTSDTTIDRLTLQALNAARRKCEMRHDWGASVVHDMRLTVEADGSSLMEAKPSGTTALGEIARTSVGGKFAYSHSGLLIFDETIYDGITNTPFKANQTLALTLAVPFSAPNPEPLQVVGGEYTIIYADLHTVIVAVPVGLFWDKTTWQVTGHIYSNMYRKPRSIINAFLLGTDGLVPIGVRSRNSIAKQVMMSNENRPIERYPSDADYAIQDVGTFLLHSNDKVWLAPSPDTSTEVSLDLTTWLDDYTTDFLTRVDFMTDLYPDMLLWHAIVQLNFRTQVFVPRQEGGLPPPQDMAEDAFQMAMADDKLRHSYAEDDNYRY